MIEQLKAAADQLRAAWDNYSSVYSTLQQYQTKRGALHAYGFPSELSSLLDTELAFVSSLSPKITQIEVAICRARNYASGIAPINALPPEVLTRIFYLVPGRPCRFHDALDYPKFPDRLTQVCSLWRQTAINFPLLWSHIHLSPCEGYDDLLDQADLYMSRAGRVPIELHISEDIYGEQDQDYEYPDYLLDDISNRVETLEMVTNRFGPFHRAVFSDLFRRGASNLKKLVLSCQNKHYSTFILPTSLTRRELNEELSHLELNISESDFARGLSAINVLHARGIFPLWSSAAYHGLVDLRLVSTSRQLHIEETEIRSILESRPGLPPSNSTRNPRQPRSKE